MYLLIETGFVEYQSVQIIGRSATGKAETGILEEFGNSYFLSAGRHVALLVGKNNCWKPYLHYLYIQGYLNRPDTRNMDESGISLLYYTKGKTLCSLSEDDFCKGTSLTRSTWSLKRGSVFGGRSLQAGDLFYWRSLHRRYANGFSEMHHCLNKWYLYLFP